MNLYYRFIRGEVSDKEIVDELFAHPERNALRYGPWGMVAFEGALILADREIASENKRLSSSTNWSESALYTHYTDLTQVAYQEKQTDTPEFTRASNVLRWYQSAARGVSQFGIGFLEAVDCLELLSTHLVAE